MNSRRCISHLPQQIGKLTAIKVVSERATNTAHRQAGRHGILARMAKKETEFEKLARLIKEEGEDIRTDVRDQIGGLRKEMHEGFTAINRRLDQIIQTQLDEHATRIKKLETAVFSK
jgi:hypothetical protein